MGREGKREEQEYASTVRRAVQSGSVSLKDRLTIELHADGRHGIVRVDRVPLAAKLVDLPCIIESLKTIDKKTTYKTADICQVLVCTVDGDLYPPLEEPAVSTDARANKKKDKDREKKFIWNHGITLPLKNVRKRRFRKTAKKKYIESPDVEKEVKPERDELREMFNEISSSSSDEDERDHHDDEDLNVMDTEEDLERRLQGKLNESSSQQPENEGTSQIG
ncbi:hypothetical protein Chor_004614 [Crotalus horridus]